MGIWSRLFGRNKKKAKNAPSKKDTAPSTNEVPAASTTATRTASEKELQPQCGALTASGDQCKRSAREGSKYCGLHKGYSPPTAQTAAKAKDTKPATKGAKDTKPTSRAKSTGGGNGAACAAVTAAGTPCKATARPNSKYCGRHKGYRASGGTSNAKSSTSSDNAGGHVSHNGYKLYQKGNRYFFSKKSQTEAKKAGAEPVFKMPADREVKETPNGLPVLKKS